MNAEAKPGSGPAAAAASPDNGLRGLVTANSFAGPASFFRRAIGNTATGADIAVLGLPYDLSVSNRPGARFGPRAIREASAQLAWGEVWPWGFDPFDHLGLIDLGDVEYIYGAAEDFRNQTRAAIAAVAQSGAISLALGGDHHTTLPVLEALAAQHGKLGLIGFDAHTDTSATPRHQHGSMFHHASGEEIIDPARSIQIGIRTAYAPGDSISRIHAPDAMQWPASEIAASIRGTVGEGPCYLTFDVDCLDPAHAPGTGTPIPGGLSTLKVLEILRALGRLPPLALVGLDIVECSPPFDHAQMTSLAAAQIAQELLCLIAAGRIKPGA